MFYTYRKVLVIISLVFCLFSSIFAYSGGSGEPNDPYQIATVSDWNDLMNTSADWNKYFIMTADVNLQGVTLMPVGNYGNRFTGVFDGNSHIIRNVDINMPNSNYVGLFGCIGSGGQIRNLGVEDVNINANSRVGGLAGGNFSPVTNCYVTGTVFGKDGYSGGLVGYNSESDITNCYAIGTVRGGGGGLIGTNTGGMSLPAGHITACYAVGTVIGGGGGLMGGNYGPVTNCYAASVVTGGGGGLIGYNQGSINESYATGSVDGNLSGGLVGTNKGNISNCYATTKISGTKHMGGLVGDNYGGIITACHATGMIIGNSSSSYIAGLVGYNNTGTITACYSTGFVFGSGAGGLLAYNGGTVTTSFWDKEKSNQTSSAGGTGKTTAQMRDVNTFLNAGWDFIGETANGTADIWQMRSDIADYPKLFWQFPSGDLNYDMFVNLFDFSILAEHWQLSSGQAGYNKIYDISDDNIVDAKDLSALCANWLKGPSTAYSGGRGTESDPYKIATKQDFLCFSADIENYNKHFIMTADIDLAGIAFNSALIAPRIYKDPSPSGYCGPSFSGTLDGNDHIIRNVDINMPGSGYIGLFGYVDANGQIRNLGVEDINISGTQGGGLVGVNYGNISFCYVTGAITGSGGGSGFHNHVAGLVGTNFGTITDCHAAVTAKKIGYKASYENYVAGGLVGYNYGPIATCYATGSIDGNLYVGGLVGLNDFQIDGQYYVGTVTACYATGAVNGSSAVGGLVGYSGDYVYDHYGAITACYATGSVSGSSHVGGLVGINDNDINDCYATGAVNGDSYVGGLIGGNGDTIVTCYATGTVNGNNYVGGLVGSNGGGSSITHCYTASVVSGNSNVGGLVGIEYGSGTSVTACFWDVNVSGQTTSAGGEGKTTTEMKTLSTFTSAGWDFSYTDGDEADWFIQIDEYPILTWQISPADIYTDGRNNFRDFAVFAQYWMREDCRIYNDYCDWADLDFNGSVDVDDLIILMSYWLQSGIYE